MSGRRAFDQLPNDLLGLVGLVYACAVDPSLLREMLQALNEWLGDGRNQRVDDRGGMVGVTASLRAMDLSGFDAAKAAQMGLLLPHFDQASMISSRLHDAPPADAAAVEMLKVLPFPCLFTDQLGRCVDRNAAFDDVQPALSVRLVVGRIRFAAAELQTTWEGALSETYMTAAGQTISATGANGKHWRIHLVPLHTVMHDGASGNRLIMAVFDDRPMEAQLPPEVAQSTSRLTRAESEVLTGLLQGLPAKAIASQRNASVNTVRVQIMAILDKTGHSSQRELMAAFSSSAFANSSSFETNSSFKLSSAQGSSFAPSANARSPNSRRN